MTGPAPREGGRRLGHLASGLLGLAVFAVPETTVTLLLAAFAAVAIFAEAARLLTRPGAALIAAVGGGLFRPVEAGRVSGGTFLAFGYLLAWLAFPAAAAARAIVVTAVCDPAAAAVGSRFSGTPGRKSWIGSMAALLSAFAVLALWPTALPGALLAAVGAAAAERLPGAGIDNIAIPLAVSALLVTLT